MSARHLAKGDGNSFLPDCYCEHSDTVEASAKAAKSCTSSSSLSRPCSRQRETLAARQEAEERLREVLAAQDIQKAFQAPLWPPHDPQTIRQVMAATEPPTGDKLNQCRQHRRPAKSHQPEEEIVE